MNHPPTPYPILEPEPARWLALVEERFGIPPATFDGLTLFRPNATYVSLFAGPPSALAGAVSGGMYFLKTSLRFPKMTTQAAMTFGPAACRNVVSLDEGGALRYVHRETQALRREAVDGCTGTGYVLVRSALGMLGVGFFRDHGEDHPAAGTLRSLFPRNWAGVRNEDVIPG